MTKKNKDSEKSESSTWYNISEAHTLIRLLYPGSNIDTLGVQKVFLVFLCSNCCLDKSPSSR